MVEGGYGGHRSRAGQMLRWLNRRDTGEAVVALARASSVGGAMGSCGGGVVTSCRTADGTAR